MVNSTLREAVCALMLQNRRYCGEFQYTVPSPQTYPYQWLWDSCFHAIILSYFNTEDAKKELLSLAAKQFENGMIPHMIYWDKAQPFDFPVVAWGKKDTSTITQPPMLAYAAWRIYQVDHDTTFLQHIYLRLKKFYLFLLTDRDPRNHHIIGIINPDESGEDNSPRFDIPLGLPPKHPMSLNFGKRLELVGKNVSCHFETATCMSNFFWVKDVPFNVIMVENLSCMAKIATIVGNTNDMEYFSREGDRIKKAMRTRMFDDGIYWSTYGKDLEKIKVKTWALFAPLFAKLYSQEEAEKVVSQYLLNEKEFHLPFLLPTVAKDEPSYDPQGFWRGPIWMATNWFVYRGLIQYNMHDIAKKIAQSSLQLLEKSGFREQFHPGTGQGLGAKDFTWGGLILDMYDEDNNYTR